MSNIPERLTFTVSQDKSAYSSTVYKTFHIFTVVYDLIDIIIVFNVTLQYNRGKIYE